MTDAVKKRGPESAAWDTLKGKVVFVTYRDKSCDEGTLDWVDHFTVGLTTRGERPLLVFKHDVRHVRLSKR